MKRTTPALGAVLALFLATAMGFGQGVSPEARRYFEAGLAAVEAAGSPADYRAAVAELEQAARLAPDWPGVFRALGLVERAARRYGDAARSFRRYVELAPGAADAEKIQRFIDDLEQAEERAASSQKVYDLLLLPWNQVTWTLIDKRGDDEPDWEVEHQHDPDRGIAAQFRNKPLFAIKNGVLCKTPYRLMPDYPKYIAPAPVGDIVVGVDGGSFAYRYPIGMNWIESYDRHKQPVFTGLSDGELSIEAEILSVDPPRIKRTQRIDWPDGLTTEASFTYELRSLVAAPVEPPAAGGPDVEGLLALGRESMAKADNGGTLLHWAAANGHTALAERLIAEGADVGARDKNGDTPLHWAAGWNKAAVAAILIAHGARPEAKRNDGATPLHDASRAGSLETADLLIAKGADPRTKAADGSTPLHYAAANGWPALADILVAKGADIGAVDANGDTPLHWASGWGKTEAARLLIARGADVNARRGDGATPLHDAARTGSIDVAGLLIAAGAGVDAEDAGGRTPLALALANDKKDVVELLKKNGGRR
ncbi:MAG TPA: ankyrin repeat domain-containing protein [Candidatus Aminicenantes bacterium]|nr:ankyrin repeat domain-containing protein [Candidatus Aminicenantes bacterium]HRY66022.1 ankyrin repeat domain-containing protein [Candidatus Aminicenantes bacterium]HRZ72929.1 ankyrin repeat domain-containing protein [Candidatus Aminicenantes bacterium]